MNNLIRNANVMIIEEDSMISSEVKNILKKVGFNELNIHKAQCLSTFKALIRKFNYDLIICRYSLDDKSDAHKFLKLYSECDRFSYECSYIYMTYNIDDIDVNSNFGTLTPDNIIGIPFNYNSFKPVILESLIKRKLVSSAYRELDKGNLINAVSLCDKISRKKRAWSMPIYRAVVEYYINNDAYDSAIDILEELRRLEPIEWVYIKLIEINSILGKFEKVTELANDFDALGFEAHASISEVTAYNSIVTSDSETALVAIENIVEKYPNSVPSLIHLVYLYVATEQYHKALETMENIDNDIIFSDEQYFCIQEHKIYLEVRLNIMEANLSRPPAINERLDHLLHYGFNDIDSDELTRKFYKIITDINEHKSISSSKEVLEVWRETNLPHRKLIAMAILFYCGFMDDVIEVINVGAKLYSNPKNINDSIYSILHKKMMVLVKRKKSQLEKAKELELAGDLVGSTVILSKETPSSIKNHVKLINTVIQSRSHLDNDLDFLMFQIRQSTNIVMNHLSVKNPKHPKITSVKKIQQTMLYKLNSLRKGIAA